MKTTFYLVTTLIEYYDQPPTDTHALYSNFADAKSAMEAEIAEGIETVVIHYSADVFPSVCRVECFVLFGAVGSGRAYPAGGHSCKVVQCHGKHNQDTEYHDRIINLVNSNADPL